MNLATNIQQNLLENDDGLASASLPVAHRGNADEHLKGVCEIAAEMFDVALACIVLHRPGEGWQVISGGRLALHPLPAEMSLSLEALASDQPLIVSDTRKRLGGYRSRGEPGWRMRFFAAIPFTLEHGRAAICLLDRGVRDLPERCRLKLENLAGIASGLRVH